MSRVIRKHRIFAAPTPIILCEGKTEQCYFKWLKQQNCFSEYRYKVFNKRFGARFDDMSDEIERIKQGYNEQTIICLFDDDVTRRDSNLKTKIEILHQKYDNDRTVMLCNSMPSIEYWLLLHFANKTMYFPSSESVAKELNIDGRIPGYNKEDMSFLDKPGWTKNLFADNGEKVKAAVIRAKSSISNKNESTSYTYVYKAIELFESIK